ncbi:hypothetical protein NBRC110019_29020 [Neptunitalea chrysea]|uniref:Cytochrome c n=1 Tax=Neptunitalea chrysea TaxID=1647581 RepID=A0A9W6B7B7_9FLAO|nr:hypothetical protein [Neptunitalea chrysea]GLB53861.1 hypothetical protein NBRC110019_29020 [Neptunitalea chrysea]
MRYLLLFCFLGILFSCENGTSSNKKVSKDDDAKTEEVFKMYEMSEMAALMEKMHKEHAVVKEKIKKGDSIGEIPEFYYEIYSATFTDNKDNDENFKKWAKLYINAEENLYSATYNNKTDAFNNAVNVCIQCHQQKCGGPIPRIKKLLIK